MKTVKAQVIGGSSYEVGTEVVSVLSVRVKVTMIVDDSNRVVVSFSDGTQIDLPYNKVILTKTPDAEPEAETESETGEANTTTETQPEANTPIFDVTINEDHNTN